MAPRGGSRSSFAVRRRWEEKHEGTLSRGGNGCVHGTRWAGRGPPQRQASPNSRPNRDSNSPAQAHPNADPDTDPSPLSNAETNQDPDPYLDAHTHAATADGDSDPDQHTDTATDFLADGGGGFLANTAASRTLRGPRKRRRRRLGR
jgi:hypothetical protein